MLKHTISEDLQPPVESGAPPSLEIGDRSVECVTTRAAEVWEIGKFCGLEFPGTDEEAIKAYVDHLKSSQPERYGVG